MGSWWHVRIGQVDGPIWGKSYVSDQLMLLFRDNDRTVNEDSLLYSSTAGVLRDRLSLQGFSTKRVRDLTIQLLDNDDEDTGYDSRDHWPEGWTMFPTATSVVDAMVSQRGVSAGGGPPSEIDPANLFLQGQWQYLKECYDDPRFALALALSDMPELAVVQVDLSDLVGGGWLTVEDNPHRNARTRLAESVAASGPVIVITEGSTDARWLERALELAAPSVAHQFKFLDFDTYKAPGGTDRVVALAKGMVSANVMNRIIVVLDNDTAGRQAAEQLVRLNFPSRTVVVNLPNVQYGNCYPVLGPEGDSNTDINGRAASIEFMFGEKVITQPNGKFYPVRWHSFIESMGAYQGRLSDAHKREIGHRIERCLNAEVRELDQEIADGCGRLSRMLLDAANPSAHLPASEQSILASWWHQEDLREARITVSPNEHD